MDLYIKNKRQGSLQYLNVIVVSRHRNKLGQTLTEPHGNISLHVDGEGLKAFLEPTDGKVTQAANILSQVNTAHLRQTQCAHWNKTWKRENREIMK